MSLDPTALTALIISIIALVATTAQLLQQYFATADGYRRCLPEVMGADWGNKTRKRMRWRELRYETLYYVPRISIELVNSAAIDNSRTESDVFRENWEGAAFGNISNKAYILGSEIQTDEQMEDEGRSEISTGSGEKVCWVSLLKRLRMIRGDIEKVYNTAAIYKPGKQIPNQTSLPNQICATPAVVCMRILRRSWDFMPFDVVRPVCVTTISDIAVLAIRLGMEWKEFKPVAGTLIAEGSGQLLTSQIVRSLGLCLEYTYTHRTLYADIYEQFRPKRSIGDILINSYLPVAGISDLVFGVVPGNKNLYCFDRSMGTLDAITEFLDFLDNTGAQNLDLTENLKSTMKDKPGWIPGFNDLIPLTSAKMTSVESNLRNIPMPNVYAPGLLRTREGLEVFSVRLNDYIRQMDKKSEQLIQVQTWISILSDTYGEYWNANESTWAYVPLERMISPVPVYKATEEYQRVIHGLLDSAEAFLVSINQDPLGSIRSDRKDQKSGFCYDTILVEHLRMSILACAQTPETDEYPGHWYTGTGRMWLAGHMNMYWDQLPKLSRKVAKYTGCETELAVDAWVTMIFRAFCWHHCHHLLPVKMTLPAEWHRSQMPVYIG
ncbi:hypothetical protein F5884DRAFT_320838 [Xylogone sp. PMI_703]|nr:hypothetical protein F5884DRAFT_320838 [Xylogone sp. PMI_703]